MSVERNSSQRDSLAEVLDPERGSSTRIRTVRAEGAPLDSTPGATLAAALLAAHEGDLRRLTRRLELSPRISFVASWLAQCAHSGRLGQESADFPLPVQRAAGPLLGSLGEGRLELAELHACELFSDLRELSLSVGSVLDVIAAFEQAAVARASGAEWGATIQALGRFLTCTAFSVFAKVGPLPALTESSERVRPPSICKAPGLRQLIGESRCMRELRAQLQDIARAPGAVLIVGESGTGKELVAEAIHRLGDFREQPFIPVNCAALPRELMESELFGHERGAFTGSRDSAAGLLRAASTGTVFLDEIGEMPELLQPKLLRALEQRAVRPVGGVREVPIHARIVAATSSDPERRSEARSLRLDLFHRLCVHRVDVPPLREPVEDIALLVRHFLQEVARGGRLAPSAFTASTLEVLSNHLWPGNVRELRNVVEHSCATAKGEPVELRHLPQRLTAAARPAAAGRERALRADSPETAPELLELRLVERRHIERVLEIAGGNKAHAARLLGLSRHQLYLKLERLGFGPSGRL